MMRRSGLVLAVIGIVSLTLFALEASATCALPNNLTNGQIADATQVMANLNALLSCINGLSGGAPNAIQYNTGSGTLGGVGPLADGQLVIGATGGAPQAASLTAGPGISITNGPGSVTITNSGTGATGVPYMVSQQAASSSSTIDFTGLNSSCTYYEVSWVGVVPVVSGGTLNAIMGTGSGPTWDTGSNYDWDNTSSRSGSPAVHGSSAESVTDIQLGENGLDNGPSQSASGVFQIFNHASTSLYKTIRGTAGGYLGSGFLFLGDYSGQYKSTSAVTGVRLTASSGNILVGTFTLRCYP